MILHSLYTQYMDPLLKSGCALRINKLLIKFKDLLKTQAYDNYDSYTVHKLKSRIIKYYGGKVAMTAEQHQTHSVYSSEISIADAINTAATYKEILKNQELIDNQEISNKKLFDRVAEIIKIDIRDCNGITIHPLDPNDRYSACFTA